MNPNTYQIAISWLAPQLLAMAQIPRLLQCAALQTLYSPTRASWYYQTRIYFGDIATSLLQGFPRNKPEQTGSDTHRLALAMMSEYLVDDHLRQWIHELAYGCDEPTARLLALASCKQAETFRLTAQSLIMEAHDQQEALQRMSFALAVTGIFPLTGGEMNQWVAHLLKDISQYNERMQILTENDGPWVMAVLQRVIAAGADPGLATLNGLSKAIQGQSVALDACTLFQHHGASIHHQETPWFLAAIAHPPDSRQGISDDTVIGAISLPWIARIRWGKASLKDVDTYLTALDMLPTHQLEQLILAAGFSCDQRPLWWSEITDCMRQHPPGLFELLNLVESLWEGANESTATLLMHRLINAQCASPVPHNGSTWRADTLFLAGILCEAKGLAGPEPLRLLSILGAFPWQGPSLNPAEWSDTLQHPVWLTWFARLLRQVTLESSNIDRTSLGFADRAEAILKTLTLIALLQPESQLARVLQAITDEWGNFGIDGTPLLPPRSEARSLPTTSRVAFAMLREIRKRPQVKQLLGSLMACDPQVASDMAAALLTHPHIHPVLSDPETNDLAILPRSTGRRWLDILSGHLADDATIDDLRLLWGLGNHHILVQQPPLLEQLYSQDPDILILDLATNLGPSLSTIQQAIFPDFSAHVSSLILRHAARQFPGLVEEMFATTMRSAASHDLDMLDRFVTSLSTRPASWRLAQWSLSIMEWAVIEDRRLDATINMISTYLQDHGWLFVDPQRHSECSRPPQPFRLQNLPIRFVAQALQSFDPTIAAKLSGAEILVTVRRLHAEASSFANCRQQLHHISPETLLAILAGLTIEKAQTVNQHCLEISARVGTTATGYAIPSLLLGEECSVAMSATMNTPPSNMGVPSSSAYRPD
ncbi:MAG: hypothetical protein EA401_06075 [Planctomycetota bacterium]|nr:MAG: hypothetical protein EA401_06075 [Planctomycetota bacterium]